MTPALGHRGGASTIALTTAWTAREHGELADMRRRAAERIAEIEAEGVDWPALKHLTGERLAEGRAAVDAEVKAACGRISSGWGLALLCGHGTRRRLNELTACSLAALGETTSTVGSQNGGPGRRGACQAG